ncbi:Bacteriocin resistance protein; peptidase C39 [uncultured Gammaproteobacteria bacterium]|uniref:C39 family peptidase n=1 Tax=Bathymodiolus heckerae thiotrophic gill symbiont TaxID=1052212 RepID=UPI0010B37456|nr:cysteine peptidase family C39 domain-containing protein [Bathymodiolus heckerae thiotrophic gill symbiont]CAC9588329.1 Bacteriocin resistance protein; peptidase C39 [uncultured Gammaproteobacteria bacterium]CAC9596911.1 Bacteriocin resistance protein; peptidase C39 [uncultured Gammaproteobacteria bacterium]SHN90896.1 bacteriocin resistance protein, putative [Bathymodiolus heckerae thiotrophic gill symbiont]
MIRLILLFCLTFTVNAGVIVPIANLNIEVGTKTWKDLRDEKIVKQDKDYSCGAASMATLLNEFYNQSFTEIELLKAMDKGDGSASFDDMAKALPQFGFRAVGYALSFEQLSKLKIPTIVYLKYRKDDHFSVLRGISNSTVWLSDPSLGNRTYSKEQFLDMWDTRDDKLLKGKILAILPNAKVKQSVDFFTKTPKRQTSLTSDLQALNRF